MVDKPGQGASATALTPRDVLLSQGATNYEDDLAEALDLSMKTRDKNATEADEMARALELSRQESGVERAVGNVMKTSRQQA